MSSIDNYKETKKEIGAKGNSTYFINLLLDSEISILGKVINEKEKEYINRIVEQIYKMDWKQEDARIKLMFDLSLLIDEIKKIQSI